jgi:hypothetical protein
MALIALFFVTLLPLNAQMVAPRNSAVQILIPAAGSLQGANGTFFRSDLTLVNYRASQQRVQLQWMPQNTPGNTITPVILTLSPHSGINSEDFVASILHQSGIGAILITGVTDAGATDPGAQLIATSRIWTPQPNAATGTNSQQFNGISTADINSGTLSIIGQRRDSRYRTNVGVVNLSQTLQSFRIDAQTSSGIESQTIDVPALSFNQTSLAGADSTLPLQILVTNVTSGSPTNAFLAYGSSVDNVTGDAWSSLGFNPPASQP